MSLGRKSAPRTIGALVMVLNSMNYWSTSNRHGRLVSIREYQVLDCTAVQMSSTPGSQHGRLGILTEEPTDQTDRYVETA